ncbi:MAG: HEAT repeat domain-containing protein, partial [candidate division WOR-3 bacterium]
LGLEPILIQQEVMGSSVEGIDGPVLLDLATEYGRVVVGSHVDNVYRSDCAVIIELGGADRYMNRAGGAVGVLDRPFSIVIDLGGDDCYFSDKLFSQGAALFGAGVLIDGGGDDVYRSRHYGQGAAVFGTGLLWDKGGTDCYRAGFFAQGAADFGAGLLVDTGGNDSYRSSCYCQGFSSTWAYGVLADHAGNDVYTAGGEYVHAPLLPHEYRSFSHGFSIGRRPDAAGGIALLFDRSGNDFYNGEVFCQGTSYWYALGMLWDGTGFDHYNAAQYSQGAGIHLAVGVLVDEEGCDAYVSRLGPSQGEGHDLSVGVLVDRKGDDIYYCSGGQGIGLTNSVGLFVDQDGNDAYTCADSFLSHGSGNAARGFGGIGLFLDLAGKDKYPQSNSARDRSRWTKGTFGSGLDLPRAATVVDEEPDVDTTDLGADSLSQPIESLFKTASIWEVGNARKKVARARKQLIRQGRKALDYVFEKKVDSKDGLESRAVEELIKAMPDTAKPYLFRALRDHRFQARQNAAYWLGQLKEKARDGVDSILAALKAGRITPRRAVNALGDIGDSTVVPKILYLLRDSYEPSRIVTSEACGKLKSRAAIPELIRTLDDGLFTVRSAAELALVAIGTPALDPLLVALPRLKSRALGHALRAAGQLAEKLDTSEQRELRVRSRRAFVSQLGHETPFVRLCAVEALGRIMDEPLVRTMKEAQAEETNEFVLARLRTILRDRCQSQVDGQ